MKRTGPTSPPPHLEDGTPLSTEAARRLCCDAALVRMVWSGEGEVLEVGRKTRTIPPALRRALEARDGGCRWPGCGVRFTDAHHVVHWADGGETNLENLLLLCPYHHRAVHEGGWRVEWWGKERYLTFIGPRGRIRIATEAPPAHGPCGRAARWGGRVVNGTAGNAKAGNGWAGDGGVRNRMDEAGTAGIGTAETGTAGEETAQNGKAGNGNGAGRGSAGMATGPRADTATDPTGPTDPTDPSDLADRLLAEHAALGIEPDGWELGPGYRPGRRLPWEVEARALEALEEAYSEE